MDAVTNLVLTDIEHSKTLLTYPHHKIQNREILEPPPSGRGAVRRMHRLLRTLHTRPPSYQSRSPGHNPPSKTTHNRFKVKQTIL